MASLVMGAVGAAIGYAITGTPQGAMIGWSVGSALGASMTELPAVQGARLSDLKVQTSSYGSFIPIMYGTSRISGQVIWSSDIIETSHTTTTGGGKGGPTQEQTTYSYSINCAIALCEGVVSGLGNVWADGKLVGNKDNGWGGARLYLGDETQLPDALLESYLGAGNVPAHRGMAYVVFENFQLHIYGNRLPSFSFEVIADGVTTALAEVVLVAPANGPLASQKIEHPTISGILLYEEIPTTGNIVVRVYDYISGTNRVVDSGIPISQALTNYIFDYKSAIYVPDTNEFWFGVNKYNDIVAYTINASSLQFGRYITVNSATWIIDPSLGWRITLAYDSTTGFVLFNSWHPNFNFLSGDLMNPNDLTYTSITNTSASFYCEEGKNSIALPQDTNPSSVKILIGGVLVAQVYAPVGTRYTALYGAAVYYDSTREQYVFRLADSGGYIVFMTIKDDGNFGTQTYTTTLLSSLYTTDRMRYNALFDSFFITGWGGAGNGHQFIVALSPDTFNEVSRAASTGTRAAYWDTFTVCTGKINYVSAIWDFSSYRGLSLLPLTDSIINAAPTASVVVQDICARAGLSVGDIDTTSLSSDIVEGYVVGSSMSARAAIEGIQPAYFFDAVESD